MSAFSLRNQGISGPIADVAGTTLLTQGRHCLRSAQYDDLKWLAFLPLTSIATQAIMFN